ncbi:MAG: zinc-ribbon domain-containing protein [Planctomycetota bacterium]|nr:zinc-ribbon domain-containing protein [Planctomycetota bacterium]
MLIQCTSCGTQAKIPQSKEGAKVKCPNCGHVYVARPVGARGRRDKKEDPTKYVIIGGAVVAAAVVGLMASRSGGEEPAPRHQEEVAAEPKAPREDLTSWDGTLQKLVRQLHTAAGAGNQGRLLAGLDARAAYEFWPAAPKVPTPPAKPADGAAPTPDAAETARPGWLALTEIDRVQFSDSMVARATGRSPDDAVALWQPYDGRVEDLDEIDGTATVIMTSQCMDSSLGLPDRATEWRLKGKVIGDRVTDWKWIWVGRWYSDAERDRLGRGLRKRPEKKTLSDGSVVYESTIRAIPFDVEVDAEARARITALVEDLADPDLTGRALTRARDGVLAEGKNAIPALLTKMSIIVTQGGSLTEFTPDDGASLQLIHESLREITGFETTFEANVALGATRERIESGVKQWFAWYDKKYKRFTGPSAPDSVDADSVFLDDPDFEPANDRERALYEKAKRERAKREKKNN